MATNTNLKTTINFGARIDSSFTGATGSLNRALKGIGTETARNRALQTAWGQQMARSLSGAAGETEKLTKAQGSLKKSIQEAALAGKDTTRLKKRYAEISKELERATRVQNRLTEAMKREIDVAERAEKVEQRRARIHDSIRGGGAATLRAGRRVVGAAASGLLSIGKWTSAGLAAGATAAIASPVLMNANTAEELGQARGYGMSIEKYKAGGALAAQFGLNAENFGDLSEEGTNKIWMGDAKSLNPLLMQLGLSQSVLQKMGRQKAFDLLMQKLSSMKDGAKAAALADELMGGESNKMLTGLHAIGKTYNQAMEEAKRYNLLTQEGAEGAMRANIAVNRLWGVAESGMQDAVGKISGALAPTVERASNELSDWIKKMQPKLTSAINDWLDPDANGETGPQRLWDNLTKFGQNVEMVGDVVTAVANRLKWLIPDATDEKRDVLKSLARTGSLEIARTTAKANGQTEWFEEQLKTNPSLFQEVRKAYTDSRGLIFDDDKAFENSLQAILARQTNSQISPEARNAAIPFQPQPQQTIHNNPNVSITVNAAPGQSTEDLGKSVYETFVKSLPDAGKSMAGNLAFDMPSL
ncbi:hypothetical protein SM021_003899 [Cronobacter muytjensii]|nr:hypothetical protein [Cronobacter muytjensii]